jgi:hypothetical protein
MRGGSAAVSLSLLAATLLTVTPVAVSAATVTDSWSARIGSAGANGWATIQLYSTGTGWIVLRLQNVSAATSLPVTLSDGTCAAVGPVLLNLPAITTDRAGASARMSSLTAAQTSAISAATVGTGTLALQVGTGSSATCGDFEAFAFQPYVAVRAPLGKHRRDRPRDRGLCASCPALPGEVARWMTDRHDGRGRRRDTDVR